MISKLQKYFRKYLIEQLILDLGLSILWASSSASTDMSHQRYLPEETTLCGYRNCTISEPPVPHLHLKSRLSFKIKSTNSSVSGRKSRHAHQPENAESLHSPKVILGRLVIQLAKCMTQSASSKLPDAIEEQNESGPIASNHDNKGKGLLALLQQPLLLSQSARTSAKSFVASSNFEFDQRTRASMTSSIFLQIVSIFEGQTNTVIRYRRFCGSCKYGYALNDLRSQQIVQHLVHLSICASGRNTRTNNLHGFITVLQRTFFCISTLIPVEWKSADRSLQLC